MKSIFEDCVFYLHRSFTAINEERQPSVLAKKILPLRQVSNMKRFQNNDNNVTAIILADNLKTVFEILRFVNCSFYG